MQQVDLIKQVSGVATYTKVVNTSFSELITATPTVSASAVTVTDFFNYYESLFYDIPVSGSLNSHAYLVQKSTQYIGAGAVDQEKQALIEEINSLRQQIIDLSQNYLNISSLT